MVAVASNSASISIDYFTQYADAYRTAQQKKRIRSHYRSLSRDWVRLVELLKESEARRDRLKPTTTLVMSELSKFRRTRIFQRGDFLAPGETVEAGIPSVWPAVPVPADRPLNRLDLARWLVDGRNPLTARVVINRHWAELFGRGLVETIEDFGTRGARPSHPELLDWLAVEFMEYGWSMKHVHELIVNSSTYRQSSRVTPKLLQRDPENRLLARGPRFRLPAEMIRDNALAVSGLLSTKAGGSTRLSAAAAGSLASRRPQRPQIHSSNR